MKLKREKINFVRLAKDENGRWWWVSAAEMGGQPIGQFHGPFATEQQAQADYEATKFPGREIRDGN